MRNPWHSYLSLLSQGIATRVPQTSSVSMHADSILHGYAVCDYTPGVNHTGQRYRHTTTITALGLQRLREFETAERSGEVKPRSKMTVNEATALIRQYVKNDPLYQPSGWIIRAIQHAHDMET